MLKKIIEAKQEQELKEAGRGRPAKNGTLAQTIDQTEDEINADATITPNGVIQDGEFYSGQGIIEDTLDRALKVNKRNNAMNADDGFINILFVGGAGTGKSSRIRAWARKNNLNLYEVRAAGMDDTDLGGAITPDKEGKVVNRLASTEFDVLNRPNSVLFLDEYNRAPQSVRTNLLELINSHVVPDPREPNGQRKLKGFLFTIAAINPASLGYNTDDIDKAELGRFRRVDVPAEKANVLNYLKFKFNKELKAAANDEEWAKELKGKLALADALLTSTDFKFDTRKDEEESDENGNGESLNNRSLTNLLVSCDGTKDDFLNQWDQFCNSNKKPMAERILRDYKDIDDIANDALKGHDTESSVFKQEKTNWEKIKELIGND